MKIPSPYPTSSIEAHYQHAIKINDGNMAPHLPRLRDLATGLSECVEFGVRRGGSSSALLLGCEHLTSYDIKATPEARSLQLLANGRWTYQIQDSATAPISVCELLFVDGLHTYKQCHAELTRHADSVTKYLVFHDTVWRGTLGEGTADVDRRRLQSTDMKTLYGALGIRPAIDELMLRDRSWQLKASYPELCGFLVLERV
jgi:hypothetical protein